MKKVILLFWLMPLISYGQIIENFESGNLNGWVQSSDGHWSADTTYSISGRYSLHHCFDNPAPGTDQIGLPLTDLQPSMGNTKWSFMIRYDNDPSSANNWCIFLLSDREPEAMIPGENVNGYAIGVNLTGVDDSLRLWKLKEGNISPVLCTGIKWQSESGINQAVIINVERSPAGKWKTDVRSASGSEMGTAEATDTELFYSSWFGIFYRYTSARDRLLWIDNVSVDGVFFKDTEPPDVIKCQAVSRNSVEITLDEQPDSGFMIPGNFSLNTSSRNACRIIILSPFSYQIVFDSILANKKLNNLIINTLCDNYSNCTQNISISFSPVWAETGDVIISEVMADPDPPVLLPAKEYLEITNRTGFSYNLKNWLLSAEDQKTRLGETIIRPGEYIIVCSVADTFLFSKYGRVTGVKSFPSLTDAGRCIILTDSSGIMIHGVEYSSDWYGEQLKAEGGWSLEIMDKNYPFYMAGNWAVSRSRTGGTPGKSNSVEGINPDKSFYGLVNVFPVDSGSITVKFSEPVKAIEKFLINIKISERVIKSIFPLDPLQREYKINPDAPLKKREKYTVDFPSSVTDFADNKIERGSLIFGLPEPVSAGDILFNEILFNPLPDEQDFIEFFNNSDKVIDASELYLVSISDETGDTSELINVSADGRCIMPGSYYAITTDRESVIRRYFSSVPDAVFTADKLPSMPDDKGHLVLFNRQLDLVDEVSYNEKMHYSLLSGYEGISLEKVRPDLPSTDLKNWHSASEASGWGTPGGANSVYPGQPVPDDNVVLSSTKFSPNNDGYEDLLLIDLNFNGNGNIVNVWIYDETGSFVRKLADNLLAGSHASVTWDGTDRDGSLVERGIYIIYVSLFDDTGKIRKWKKICTVLR